MPSDHEQDLTTDIVELATRFGRYGYRRITALLRERGWSVNHKRIERIWRREGLKVPRREQKRGRPWLSDGSCVRLRPLRPNHVWAYDFVATRTHDGRGVRLLTIMDEYTRECLAIRAERSIRSSDVIETLTGLMTSRGVPEHIRSDNGPEFTAKSIREWLADVGAKTPVRRARIAVGERLHREFQRQAEGRAVGRGGLLHDDRGEGVNGSIQADIQPGQAAQLPRLSATSTGNHPAHRIISGAGTSDMATGTRNRGRSLLQSRE